MIFCDGRPGGPDPGFRGLLTREEEKLDTGGCCIYDYPDNDYSYCTPGVSERLICDGSLPNRTFFAEMGAVGQSCEDWGVLTELMEGVLTPRDIASMCETIKPHANTVVVLVERRL